MRQEVQYEYDLAKSKYREDEGTSHKAVIPNMRMPSCFCRFYEFADLDRVCW